MSQIILIGLGYCALLCMATAAFSSFCLIVAGRRPDFIPQPLSFPITDHGAFRYSSFAVEPAGGATARLIGLLQFLPYVQRRSKVAAEFFLCAFRAGAVRAVAR